MKIGFSNVFNKVTIVWFDFITWIYLCSYCNWEYMLVLDIEFLTNILFKIFTSWNLIGSLQVEIEPDFRKQCFLQNILPKLRQQEAVILRKVFK